MKSRTAVFTIILFSGILLAQTPNTSKPDTRKETAATKFDPSLPLLFIENQGQLDNQTQYYAQGQDGMVRFTRQSVRFDTKNQRLELKFLGARPNSQPEARELAPTRVNYLTGQRRQWKTNLQTFREVVYTSLWPGVDLFYSAPGNRLEYTLELKPGADVNDVRLSYAGAASLVANSAGELEIITSSGSLRDARPVAWQHVGSNRVPVDVRYVIHPDLEFGFAVGDYDHTKPLVIDPPSFVYGGYLGGPGNDRGLGIALDNSGAAYATGELFSSVTNSIDIYVAKINSTGTALDYFTVIGGTDYDAGYDIRVDSTGRAYFTGGVRSSEVSFPVVGGPDLTFNGGGIDAFIARLDPTGSILEQCGYLGGSGFDFAEGIVVDAAGNVYVTGATDSTEATLPVRTGPDLTSNGGFDVFVAKMIPAPTNPAPSDNYFYLGYVGGSNDDLGIIGRVNKLVTAGQIAINAAGNAYVVGITKSAQDSFPNGNGFSSLPGLPGFDQTHNGGDDGFVAEIRADGTGFVYATYIGGSDDEFVFGPALDTAGNVYITGHTLSDQTTFPVTVGPDLTFNGNYDGFVAKINPSGTALIYCGYIGGRRLDQGIGLATDNAGRAYVIGYTFSSSRTFPVQGGPDLTFNSARGSGDAYLAVVKADGTGIVNASYIGGSGHDGAFGVALDAAGNAYIVGDTASNEATFPNGDGFASLPALPGWDQTLNGGVDGFVVVIAQPATATLIKRSAGESPEMEEGPDLQNTLQGKFVRLSR